MNITPTSDNIIFTEVQEEKTAGGIIVPTGAAEGEIIKGVVVASGKSCDTLFREIEIPLKPGDIIYYESKMPTQKLDEKHHLIRYQNIRAWERPE